MDADDFILGFDLPVVGRALGLDLRLIVAHGHVVRGEEPEGDDLLLILFERRDQIGFDLRPPIQRQVGEDPDVVQFPGPGVFDPDVHRNLFPDLDLVIEVDGLNLDLADAPGDELEPDAAGLEGHDVGRTDGRFRRLQLLQAAGLIDIHGQGVKFDGLVDHDLGVGVLRQINLQGQLHRGRRPR